MSLSHTFLVDRKLDLKVWLSFSWPGRQEDSLAWTQDNMSGCLPFRDTKMHKWHQTDLLLLTVPENIPRKIHPHTSKLPFFLYASLLKTECSELLWILPFPLIPIFKLVFKQGTILISDPSSLFVPYSLSQRCFHYQHIWVGFKYT